MNKESACLKPTLGNYKALITQSVSERVKQINNFTLEYFAKKSIINYGFFTVLRIIESEKIYIKLYYYSDINRHRKREIEDFSSELYRSEIKGLSYLSCNIMTIPLKTKVNSKIVNSCKSMDDMELIFLNTLTNDSWVSISLSPPEGNLVEGGLTVNPPISSEYHKWKKLFKEGYIEPEHEEKFKAESSIEEVDTEKKNDSSADNSAEERSINIQVFMKTGGSQPATWEAKAIDRFFKGNLAKKWAMCDGYLPTYTGYENGKIQFKLITDTRCTGLYWISLCNHIANQYKENVMLLKDATHFKAEHFIANDIIGFNINANDTDKFNKYNGRVQATYASLPLKPEVTHYGKIK
jgi:hypothetical protein